MADAAFRRTIESRPGRPLNERWQAGPSREGVSRLRGAYAIDTGKLRPDPDQPRRDFPVQELAELTASVAERGIKQPIRVWYVESEDVYQIISGERRYRAALAAGLASVSCLIEDAPAGGTPLPRREILVDQIVENWQREDLNPYDLSDALKELRDQHGLSQDEIARLTGKSKSEISRFLAMQAVSPGVRQEIRQDTGQRFSRRHVVALAQLSPSDQPALAAKIKTEKLSAVETEREVARQRRRQEGRAFDRGLTRHYAPLCGRVRQGPDHVSQTGRITAGRARSPGPCKWYGGTRRSESGGPASFRAGRTLPRNRR